MLFSLRSGRCYRRIMRKPVRMVNTCVSDILHRFVRPQFTPGPLSNDASEDLNVT